MDRAKQPAGTHHRRPAATLSDTWSAGSTGTRLRRWCSISCRTRSSAIRNSGELEA